MGMLIDLLPLLKGWEYKIVDYEDEVVQPQSTLDVVFSQGELGWFATANATVEGEGAEDVKWAVRIDDFEFDKTFRDLQQSGYTQRGLLWVYIYRYDAADNVFSLGFETSPFVPYNTFVRFRMIVPSGIDPVTLTTATVGRIRIKRDKQELFERSLSRVLGTSQLVEKLKPREGAE